MAPDEQVKSRKLDDWTVHLERAELYIYVSTAFVLVFAAAGMLLLGIYEMVARVAEGDFIRGLLHLLDRALLVLMLAEIIYTVGRIARKLRLEVEPFLIVGVIAAVRRMLVITAESATHVDLQDPAFQAALAELGLLALVILAIAVAMRLLRMEGEESH
ncbi:MAG: phosphate-starvation-inducible PsiE family protein [Gammaproteobacteria bacterium]|nr:phosphate-starvation-inducible PsiE family protein [Gammaproteobacteria bacterium]